MTYARMIVLISTGVNDDPRTFMNLIEWEFFSTKILVHVQEVFFCIVNCLSFPQGKENRETRNNKNVQEKFRQVLLLHNVREKSVKCFFCRWLAKIMN